MISLRPQAATADTRIGSMVAGEGEGIARVARMCFTAGWTAAAFEDERRREIACVRVIREQGTPIAFSHFWIVGQELQLHHLATEPGARRRGHADSLLRDMFSIARAQGVHDAHLEVRVSNQAAIRLYERFGFQGIGVRPDYYVDDREDALVMYRTIANVDPGISAI